MSKNLGESPDPFFDFNWDKDEADQADRLQLSNIPFADAVEDTEAHNQSNTSHANTVNSPEIWFSNAKLGAPQLDIEVRDNEPVNQAPKINPGDQVADVRYRAEHPVTVATSRDSERPRVPENLNREQQSTIGTVVTAAPERTENLILLGSPKSNSHGATRNYSEEGDSSGLREFFPDYHPNPKKTFKGSHRTHKHSLYGSTDIPGSSNDSSRLSHAPETSNHPQGVHHREDRRVRDPSAHSHARHHSADDVLGHPNISSHLMSASDLARSQGHMRHPSSFSDLSHINRTSNSYQSNLIMTRSSSRYPENLSNRNRSHWSEDPHRCSFERLTGDPAVSNSERHDSHHSRRYVNLHEENSHVPAVQSNTRQTNRRAESVQEYNHQIHQENYRDALVSSAQLQRREEPHRVPNTRDNDLRIHRETYDAPVVISTKSYMREGTRRTDKEIPRENNPRIHEESYRVPPASSTQSHMRHGVRRSENNQEADREIHQESYRVPPSLSAHLERRGGATEDDLQVNGKNYQHPFVLSAQSIRRQGDRRTEIVQKTDRQFRQETYQASATASTSSNVHEGTRRPHTVQEYDLHQENYDDMPLLSAQSDIRQGTRRSEINQETDRHFRQESYNAQPLSSAQSHEFERTRGRAIVRGNDYEIHQEGYDGPPVLSVQSDRRQEARRTEIAQETNRQFRQENYQRPTVSSAQSNVLEKTRRMDIVRGNDFQSHNDRHNYRETRVDSNMSNTHFLRPTPSAHGATRHWNRSPGTSSSYGDSRNRDQLEKSYGSHHSRREMLRQSEMRHSPEHYSPGRYPSPSYPHIQGEFSNTGNRQEIHDTDSSHGVHRSSSEPNRYTERESQSENPTISSHYHDDAGSNRTRYSEARSYERDRSETRDRKSHSHQDYQSTSTSYSPKIGSDLKHSSSVPEGHLAEIRSAPEEESREQREWDHQETSMTSKSSPSPDGSSDDEDPTDKPRVCKECGRKFKKYSGLSYHRSLHVETPKKFFCVHCKTEFGYQGIYARHVRNFSGEKYMCTSRMCRREFECSTLRRLHYDKRHRKKFQAPKEPDN